MADLIRRHVLEFRDEDLLNEVLVDEASDLRYLDSVLDTARSRKA